MLKRNIKNIVWNSIGSTLNAINSLVFLIIVTRINGVDISGIFTYAYATACLFYTIAVYYGRAYQVTDNSNQYTDSDYLYNRLFTIIITLLAMLIFALFKQYDGLKILILMLLAVYRCTDAFSESLYAIIQREDRLDIIGKSLAMKSIFGYIVFLGINLIFKNVALSISSIIFTNIITTYFYDYKNAKKFKITTSEFTWGENKKLIKDGFIVFFFSFLTIYVINAPRYSIDSLMPNDAQTIFGIIAMPAMVMSLLSQFIIHPFLIKIKSELINRNYPELQKIIMMLFSTMVGIGIFVIAIAYFLGIPVLQFLYNISLPDYHTSFMIIMVGALFYGLWLLVSYILIAMRINKQQSVILVFGSLMALLLSNYLVNLKGILGASISYGLTMLVILILYILLLIKSFYSLRRGKNEK